MAGIRNGKEILVWDMKGNLKHTYHAEKPVAAVAFHPTEDTIAWLHVEKEKSLVAFHDSQTGEHKKTMEMMSAKGPLIQFSPDGSQLVVGSRTMELWEPRFEKQILVFPSRPPIDELVFSKSGDKMLLVSSGVACRKTCEGVAAPPNAHVAALSPDGGLLATAESDVVSEVVLWQVASGKRAVTLRGHDGAALDMAFSHDGRKLMTLGSDGAVLLWSLPAVKAGGGHH